MGRNAHRQAKAPPGSSAKPAPQHLREFKLSWASGDWIEAVNHYRAWTNRTGAKRDPRIEGELLFRSASLCHQKNDLDAALRYLDEAVARDPSSVSRCLHLKGICLARKGNLPPSREAFVSEKDDFHALIVSTLNDSGRFLPKAPPEDCAFDRHQLLPLWHCLTQSGETEPSSPALRNIVKAYRLLGSGEDPEPQILLLKQKAGFESVAIYLSLLAAVHKRKAVKVRNFIRANPAKAGKAAFARLLDCHLLLLLKEKRYCEVRSLEESFRDIGAQPSFGEALWDEALFNLGLREIDEGDLEVALECFFRMRTKTTAVLHNTALVLQKLERFSEANEHWIRLARTERKPKRSDPEELRTAYATALKFIAFNFGTARNHKESVTYLKEALALVPDDREILEELCTLSGEIGDQGVARYAKMLYELQPGSYEYLLAYIMALRTLERFDELLPVCQTAGERFPDDPLLRGELADCYARSAWRLIEENPEAAQELVEKARGMDAEHPLIPYFEGIFLMRKGYAIQAQTQFELAVRRITLHRDQYWLGIAFYNDGLTEHARRLFKQIIACDCDTSVELFEMIIGFLAENNDEENARYLCDYAIAEGNFHPSLVADALFSNGKSQWAKPYSMQLIEEGWGAGQDDRFLHILILNEIGNGEETLAYAQRFMELAHEENDRELVDLYKYIIKQVRAKGKAKIPYG